MINVLETQQLVLVLQQQQEQQQQQPSAAEDGHITAHWYWKPCCRLH
jgi:hypothetical protein